MIASGALMRQRYWTQTTPCAMNIIRLSIIWGTLALAGAGKVDISGCNVSLPWTFSRTDYNDVSDSVFHSLFQCPGDLNGCGNGTLLSCWRGLYLKTCSCASNCGIYRDCCWETGIESVANDLPESSCLKVNIYGSIGKYLYMITGCRPSWPNDEVREACEKTSVFNETFYHIPVTSVNDFTYKNGYCALCNYDLVNVTFWNATAGPPSTKSYVQLPDIVTSQPYLHLRPCSRNPPNDTCPVDTSVSITQKCKTFYAPVTVAQDSESPVFRNVYCAMCNGANLSALSCKLAEHLSNFSSTSRNKGPQRGPNLAFIFHPVVRTKDCFVKHLDRCFIKSRPKLFPPRQNGNNTNRRTQRSHHRKRSYSVENYLTIVCVSISICCLILKIVVFSIYKEARSFSSKCTLCLSVTLLTTQLVFLLVNSFKALRAVCTASAMLVHYGFLSTFFWTSVLSFDIWRSITAVKLSSTRRKTLAFYAVAAWGAPMMIVAVAAMVNWLAPKSAMFPLYGDSSCWFGSIWAQITYFLAPIAVLLVLGIFLYLNTVFYIRKTTGRARDMESKDGVQRSQHSHMTLFVRLALIMGVTWGMGFLGFFVNSTIIDILVILLVGLQGVYLFFGFKDHKHFFSSIPQRKTSSSAAGQSNVTFSTD